MSQLVLTNRQIIWWWELRRLPYNAVLFVIGIASLTGMEWIFSAILPVGDDAIEPLLLATGVILYGIAANACYTLGWIIEMQGRRNDPVAARERGQWMFKVGTSFSALLTTVPFLYACVYWVLYRINAHMLR